MVNQQTNAWTVAGWLSLPFLHPSVHLCPSAAEGLSERSSREEATKHSLCAYGALRQNEMGLCRHGLGSSTQTNKTNVLETAGEEDENEHH